MPETIPKTVKLDHLSALMGPLGIYQHAKYSTPRLEEGYCTDDNARAVQLFFEWRQNSPSGAPGKLALFQQRCWQFVTEAQAPDGQFRNFRDAAGTWLDDAGSEDTQARTARALATAIAYDPDHRAQAQAMLDRLRPHLERLMFPRSIAEATIALALAFSNQHTQAALASLWHRLWQRWQHQASRQWPWPEEQLTYANALLPHGLLAGAAALNQLDSTVTAALHDSVNFLVQLTCRPEFFSPIGTAGWYQRGSTPARYDQQPIEAHTTLDLLIAYRQLLPTPLPADIVASPYQWFWGRNSQNTGLVDPARGACYDGLTPRGVNENQGAESLLAYLRSELLIARQQTKLQ